MRGGRRGGLWSEAEIASSGTGSERAQDRELRLRGPLREPGSPGSREGGRMKKFDEQFYKDRVNTFPFVKLMGMKLLSSGAGKSVMQCRIRPVLRNTVGA